MANKPQAKKRIRQDIKRNLRNHGRMTRIRTFVRKVEEAIQSKNYNEAFKAMSEAMPEIHRGVTKGVLHKNNAARKISRLSTRIKKLAS